MIYTKFNGRECFLEYGRYQNGRLAIILKADSTRRSLSIPIAIATVNIPDESLEDHEVIIKSWSENEGMFQSLLKAGVVEDTGKRVRTGFVEAEICKLTQKTIDDVRRFFGG